MPEMTMLSGSARMEDSSVRREMTVMSGSARMEDSYVRETALFGNYEM